MLDSTESLLKTNFSICDLIRDVAPIPPEMKSTNFSTYSGSLTTPGCDEVVHWINFLTPLTISRYQLSVFRYLDAIIPKGGAEDLKITNNVRPIQDLNGRTVSLFRNPDPE